MEIIKAVRLIISAAGLHMEPRALLHSAFHAAFLKFWQHLSTLLLSDRSSSRRCPVRRRNSHSCCSRQPAYALGATNSRTPSSRFPAPSVPSAAFRTAATRRHEPLRRRLPRDAGNGGSHRPGPRPSPRASVNASSSRSFPLETRLPTSSSVQ